MGPSFCNVLNKAINSGRVYKKRWEYAGYVTGVYRTLRGQDQREKCALIAIKHTFQANSALLTTKSALNVQ